MSQHSWSSSLFLYRDIIVVVPIICLSESTLDFKSDLIEFILLGLDKPFPTLTEVDIIINCRA